MALWSNLNGIVRRLEQTGSDVPALLELMAQEINKAKRELLRVMGEEKVLREHARTRFAEMKKWQSRAELAVKSQNDDLAREALAQARRLQGETEHDTNSADEYGALAQSIRTDIAQMEQRHRGWSSRKKTIAANVERARAGGGVEALGAQPGTNAFEEFRRAEESIEAAEFSVAAEREVQEVFSPRPDLEADFEKLEQSAKADGEEPGNTNVTKGLESPMKDGTKRRVRVE
jgi:phage shock protein A